MSINPLNTQCPFCKAVTGAPCVRANGVKRAPHAQRKRRASNPLFVRAERLAKVRDIGSNDVAIGNAIDGACRDFRAILWDRARKPNTTDGSPIEKAMRMAFVGFEILIPRAINFAKSWEDLPFGDQYSDYLHPLIFICPQAQVGPYRADFLLVSRHERAGSKFERIVAVECDGYEFHDRNKTTIERDKARDRYFASRNILVMRFAGSEIHRDAWTCVSDIITPISEAKRQWLVGIKAAA